MARVKLLMSWDIKQGQDTEYLEFVVREWAPGITRLGLTPTEAWYTVYGDHPQISTVGVADDLETMQHILASPEWEELHGKLLQYVDNFTRKIVPAAGHFQI